MSEHDVHQLAAAYALDAVDPDEREVFEAHLAECDACRAEVDEFRSIHSSMARAQAVTPPPALKARVLDEIGRTRQVSPLVGRSGGGGALDVSGVSGVRRRWAVGALAAAAAVALLVVGVVVFSGDDRTDQFADELATVLEQPDAQMLELAEQPGGVGRFKVAWSDSLQEAVLIGDGLAPAPEGQAYELWLITADQSMAMHILDPAADGNVHTTLAMPQSPAKWAITLEPRTGVEVATGDIIFIGSVS